MNKFWKVNDKEELYSDAELKKLIKSGNISMDDVLYTEDMDAPIKLKESIYALYATGEKK